MCVDRCVHAWMATRFPLRSWPKLSVGEIRFRDVTGSRSRKKFCWEQKRFREKMAARGARQMPRTGARARITEQNLITA